MNDIDINVPVSVAGFYCVEATNRKTGVKRTLMEIKQNAISPLGLNDIEEGYYPHNTMMLMKDVITEGESKFCCIRNTLHPEFAAYTTYRPYPYYEMYPEYPLPFPGPGALTLSTVPKESTYVYASRIFSAPTGREPFYAGWSRTYRFDSNEAFTFKSMGLGGKVWISGTFGPHGTNHPDGGYHWWYFFSNINARDSNGDLIELTKEEDDIIDVTFEFRCYAPTGDILKTFEYEGVEYEARIRPARKYFNQVGDVSWNATNRPSNFIWTSFSPNGIGSEQGGIDSQTVLNSSGHSYLRHSHVAKGSCYVHLDSANFVNGIKSMLFESYRGYGAYQVEFTPSIPKNRYKALRFSFGIRWSEYDGPP